MLNSIYATLHPERYHGFNVRPPFFEGWYYKLVSADENHRYAIIPGVILGPEGHAFVQVLDGSTGASSYHSYPLDEFRSDPDAFEVAIGPNRFSGRSIEIQIQSPRQSVTGKLAFENPNPWPVRWFSPGIMGPYAWVPAMECYHGVLSFDHAIHGELKFDGAAVDFSNGRGYIEKDWGKSFPSAWVWFQSNHFETPGICITASTAIIPWLRTAFRGFIVGLWLRGRLYTFATYTGAKTELLSIYDDHVEWRLTDRRYRLELSVQRAEGGLLRGPSRADMGKRVDETMRARVNVRLCGRQGRCLFEGQGRNSGLEVHGELDRLLRMQ